MFELVWFSYRLQVKYYKLFDGENNLARNVGFKKNRKK